ncbi:MAG: hypothetical protein ABIQ47_00555 [Tepidiformaceae bacterium]
MTTRPQHSFHRHNRPRNGPDVLLSMLVVAAMTALLALVLVGAQAMPDGASSGPRGGPSLQSNVTPASAPGAASPTATQQPGLPPAR